MRYEQAKNLPTQQFKRLFGVQRRTFDKMVEVMRDSQQAEEKVGSPKLSLDLQVLVGLQKGAEISHVLSDCG